MLRLDVVEGSVLASTRLAHSDPLLRLARGSLFLISLRIGRCLEWEALAYRRGNGSPKS